MLTDISNNKTMAKPTMIIELVPITTVGENMENEENNNVSVVSAKKIGAKKKPNLAQSSLKSVPTIPSCLEMALEMADKAAAVLATARNSAATMLQTLARGFAQYKVFKRIMRCTSFFVAPNNVDIKKLCNVEEHAMSIHASLQQKLNVVISNGFPGFYWNKNMKKVFIEMREVAAKKDAATKAAATNAAAAVTMAMSIHASLQQKLNVVISNGFPGFYWNKNMKKVFIEMCEVTAKNAAEAIAVATAQAEDDKAKASASVLLANHAKQLVEKAKSVESKAAEASIAEEEAKDIEAKKRLKSLSTMFQHSAERMKNKRLARRRTKKNLLTVKKTFNSVGRVRFVLSANKKAPHKSTLPSSVREQEVSTVRKAPRRLSSLPIPSSKSFKQQDLRAKLDEYKRKKKEKKEHDDMKLKKKELWRC